MEQRGARMEHVLGGEPEPKLSRASRNWTESPSGILKGENLPGTVEGIIQNHTTSKHLIPYLKSNQLSAAGMKRKPSDLILELPEPGTPPRTKKYPRTDLPRTPYPVSRNDWECSMPLNGLDDAQEEGEIRKRKIVRKAEVASMSSPQESCPSLGTGNTPTSLRLDISPTELMRALKSMLNQVNWSEVVLDIAGKERSTAYRNAFEKVVKAQVEEMLVEYEGDGNDEDDEDDESDEDDE